MDASQALAAFSALSQQARLDTLRLLVGAGPKGMAAGEIALALGAVQNTMSGNLGILLAAGLVRNRREGRRVLYFADLDGVRGLLGFLMQDCCGGRPELCQPALETLGCAS